MTEDRYQSIVRLHGKIAKMREFLKQYKNNERRLSMSIDEKHAPHLYLSINGDLPPLQQNESIALGDVDAEYLVKALEQRLEQLEDEFNNS